MNLHVQTILVVLLANVLATAIALPIIMGLQVSTPARRFQQALIVQALGWGTFLLAPRVHDQALSTVSIGLLSASFVLLRSALSGWLGPRPGERAMWALAVLTPLGYGLSFDSYPLRVGWSNFGLALQLLLLCVVVASPAPDTNRRWRGLVLLCMASLALVTAWRGVLGAFFTEAYPFYRATHPINVAATLLYHVSLALSTIGLLVAWREEAERELRRRAHTDSLTGLLNRQAFTERAAELMARAMRYGEPVSVVMIDIDHFKVVNDTYGHAAGDTALRLFAQALRACIRKGDLVCRHGGEEFCVLMTRAEAGDAAALDQRLRAHLRDNAASYPGGRLDFSAGCATREAGESSLERLINRADAALYEAKAQGRGRLLQAGSRGAT